MSKRIVSGIMFVILLVGMLTLSSNIQPVKGNPKTWNVDDQEPADFPKTCDAIIEADLAYASGAPRNHWSIPTIKSLFEDELDKRLIDAFEASGKWDFDNQEKWGDFAYVYDDSVKLVIGLDDTRLNSYTELVNIIMSNDGELVNAVSMNNKIRAVVAGIPRVAMSTFASEVENARLSRYIERNVRFEVDFIPNDPDWPKQWGPRVIEADYAWNTTMGDPSILVAIVDTGIDYSHQDLAANYVPLGYDWVNNDPDPMDDHGHGTHCAGILSAVINNSVGIAGLAQVRIIAEKALDRRGRGYSDWLANAIIHAVDQGARIISMSWGGNFYSELIYDAIRYAHDLGVLLVAAAGNEAWGLKHYPAAYDEVIAVSATDDLDKPALFTNFADWVELAAPGVRIYSTFPYNSYRYMSGTSMSTPYVSGVASLIWSQFPNMTQNQVRIQLRRTAEDLGCLGFDEFFGYGRVNARNAVDQVLPNSDLLILKWNSTRCAKPGDLMIANVTILNFGKSNESDITVQLMLNDSMVDSLSIGFLASGDSTTVNFVWNSTKEGVYDATFYVVPVPGEEIVENNVVSMHVLIRIERAVHVPRDFQTIKEAINIASSGFTIYVASGLYYEHLVIYRSLKLVGEHPSTTFIDSNETGTVLIAFSTSNISISGFTIQNSQKTLGIYSFGIYLCCTNCSTFYNNVVMNNNLGICLDYSDVNNIANNTILNSKGAGFVLSSSNGNNINDNRVLNNGAAGISLQYSTNNTLRNNDVGGNLFNFGVEGDRLSDFINYADSSNTVDGKPVYYWLNQHDKQIPTDAGYVAAVNSTRLTVTNLNLTNNSEGLLLVHTTESVVENVNTSNNFWGIRLFCSNNNTANRNTIKNNLCGVYLSNSTGNTLSDSVIDSLELTSQDLGKLYITVGTWLQYSSNNIILENAISNHNFGGIHLDDCSDNTLMGNRVASNGFFGIGLYFWSSNTIIIENQVTNNTCGIWINVSGNNTIYHNNLINNPIQADLYLSFNNTWDDSYPSGGNYWSDYAGNDIYTGPYQNLTGSDGISDTSYIIDANNQDRYPLMNPWKPSIPGDIYKDGKVDLKDFYLAAITFGLCLGHPEWNPIADVNDDGRVDLKDIYSIAINYGKVDP